MKYIVANWKSNKNLAQAQAWLDEFEKQGFPRRIDSDTQVIIAPPMPFVATVSERISSKIAHPQTALAVQDISPLDAGSYTGAVNPVNLEGLGVKFAILGHSERRQYFHETDQDVANKVERCIEAGIKPIVCVDEDYLASQASAIADENLKKCIVAYEPLSAIGTGDEMSVDKVTEVALEIKKYFGKVDVIYGGSVNSKNVEDYLDICDGVLVGGASLDPQKFMELVR